MPMPSRPSTRRLQVKDAPRDYLLYLKGRALHLDGKYDEAIAVFDQLGKELPKSPGHAGHALPRPSRWPARATSAAPS